MIKRLVRKKLVNYINQTTIAKVDIIKSYRWNHQDFLKRKVYKNLLYFKCSNFI